MVDAAGSGHLLILGNRLRSCVSSEYSFRGDSLRNRHKHDIAASRLVVTVVTGWGDISRKSRRSPMDQCEQVQDRWDIGQPTDRVRRRLPRHEEAGEIAARLSKIVTSSDGPAPTSNAPAPSKRILLGPALAKPEEFHSRLGKMLIDRDLVTRDELRRALERQADTGERLGEALVSLGAVSSADVAKVLAEQLRFPFIDLQNGSFDPELFGVISGSVARRFSALPVARWSDKIVIAMANPNKPGALEELRDIVGAPIMPAVADPIELRVKIEQLYGSSDQRVAIAGGIEFACPGCARAAYPRRGSVGHAGAAPRSWALLRVGRESGALDTSTHLRTLTPIGEMRCASGETRTPTSFETGT